jgi:hypothetical protein
VLTNQRGIILLTVPGLDSLRRRSYGRGDIFGNGSNRGCKQTEQDRLPNRDVIGKNMGRYDSETNRNWDGSELGGIAVALVGALVRLIQQGSEQKIEASVDVALLGSKRRPRIDACGDLRKNGNIYAGRPRERGGGVGSEAKFNERFRDIELRPWLQYR